MVENTWLEISKRASRFETPFYLLWQEPFETALRKLSQSVGAATAISVQQWYSFKTLPVPRMAEVARSMGLGIEVVSEFELETALTLGFPHDCILVNGVAKHAWLVQKIDFLNVIFDSMTEVTQLGPRAHQLAWKIGLRVAVSNQRDADDPSYPAQFGLAVEDLGRADAVLRALGLTVDILHFHLRSNVSSTADYSLAISEIAAAVHKYNLSPKIVDIGGGLPDETIGNDSAAAPKIELSEYATTISYCCSRFPEAKSIWLENGRYLLGPAGVLVVTVRDTKVIQGTRFLICDGGRTNHALESDWAPHNVLLMNATTDRQNTEPTVICGPTCMAYDWIFRGHFSSDAKIGDRLVYLNAGAYHIPWETRFSHGLARVVFTRDGLHFEELRAPETKEQWLSHWSNARTN